MVRCDQLQTKPRAEWGASSATHLGVTEKDYMTARLVAMGSYSSYGKSGA